MKWSLQKYCLHLFNKIFTTNRKIRDNGRARVACNEAVFRDREGIGHCQKIFEKNCIIVARVFASATWPSFVIWLMYARHGPSTIWVYALSALVKQDHCTATCTRVKCTRQMHCLGNALNYVAVKMHVKKITIMQRRKGVTLPAIRNFWFLSPASHNSRKSSFFFGANENRFQCSLQTVTYDNWSFFSNFSVRFFVSFFWHNLNL